MKLKAGGLQEMFELFVPTKVKCESLDMKSVNVFSLNIKIDFMVIG